MRERVVVEALCLSAAVLGSAILLGASCLGREANERASRAELRSAPLVVPDAGTWNTPLSGMAAHSTYDPEENPVTPNGYGAPSAPPQVPRLPQEDAGGDGSL